MAKRKKTKVIRPSVIKPIIVGLLAVVIGLIICNRTLLLVRHSEYFKIKTINVDPALSFINKRGLENLKGKSIFLVDLKKVQRRLQFKYPQISQLRIVKRLPDQISVLAKQRFPFAQVHLKNRTLTLDDKGVVVSTAGSQDKKLPLVLGMTSDYKRIALGRLLEGKDVQIVLKIIKAFGVNKALSSYRLLRIDVKNLSKINVYLSDNLKVILDGNEVDQKIKVLGLVLSQGELDLKHVAYIDLRFKELTIGKK